MGEKSLSYSHSVRYMVKSVAKEAKFSYLRDGKIPLKYCYSAKLYRLALSNTCVWVQYRPFFCHSFMLTAHSLLLPLYPGSYLSEMDALPISREDWFAWVEIWLKGFLVPLQEWIWQKIDGPSLTEKPHQLEKACEIICQYVADNCYAFHERV